MRDSIFRSIGRLVLPFVAIGAFLVSLADFFGLLGQFELVSSRIPTFTLLLMSATILYWLQEQQREHEKMQKVFDLISSGLGAEHWSTTDQPMQYLTKRFGEAESSVDQAALAPSLSPPDEYVRYDQALTKMLKKGTVRYRHTVLLDKTRWKRVKSFLNNPDVQRYFVRYYDQPESSLPNLSFVVIDESEVVMRYPYSPDQSEVWVSIKHIPTVQLFTHYFAAIYRHGNRLEKTDEQILDGLDGRYGG